MIDIQNTREYIESFLHIRTKRGEIIRLRLNPAQEKLDKALEEQDRNGSPMRAIILKARQLGFSTYSEARIFQRTATRFNVKSLILAHLDSSTSELFRMIKLFYACLPVQLQPMLKKSNSTELIFENPARSARAQENNPGLRSSISCSTAGSGFGIGRGMTIQNLHCSEFAFWRGDKKQTLLGLMQAVPPEKDTLVIIESTANGFDEFQKLWSAAMAGENDFRPIFCGWQENGEYRRPAPKDAQWTEKELTLKMELGLDDEQLAWRRWCIRNNCQGDERTFRQEYPATPDEAFLTSGDGVFDNETVMARRNSLGAPLHRGYFVYDYVGERITNIEWHESETGEISIYAEPDALTPYVLGGDTAGEDADFFAGHVLDNTTSGQVAVLRKQTDEIWFTRQMYCLGRWYNWALMGIEANFTTYPQRELERLGYPNFYKRERYDTASHKTTDAYGFLTTRKTRPTIISGLKAAFEADPEIINDYATLGEMLTFIMANGRPEAAQGEHDDLVMSLAIAHEIRKQQSYMRRTEREETRTKLIDKLERRHR